MLLASIMKWISDWSGGCPCHEQDMLPTSARTTKQRFIVKQICESATVPDAVCSVSTCPIRGRRAPDIATGVLHRHVLNSLVYGCSELCFATRHLPAPAAAKLRMMYEVGQQRLLLGCRIKLGCWTQCPWRICGLASHNRQAAVLTARTLLNIWSVQNATQVAVRVCVIAVNTLLVMPNGYATVFFELFAGWWRLEACADPPVPRSIVAWIISFVCSHAGWANVPNPLLQAVSSYALVFKTQQQSLTLAAVMPGCRSNTCHDLARCTSGH